MKKKKKRKTKNKLSELLSLTDQNHLIGRSSIDFDHFFQSFPCQLPLLFQCFGIRFFLYKLSLALFKQVIVHVEEHLPDIRCQTMDCLIPVALHVPLKCFKYDWEDNIAVLCNQANNMVVVPEKQCTLSNLTRSFSVNLMHRTNTGIDGIQRII